MPKLSLFVACKAHRHLEDVRDLKDWLYNKAGAAVKSRIEDIIPFPKKIEAAVEGVLNAPQFSALVTLGYPKLYVRSLFRPNDHQCSVLIVDEALPASFPYADLGSAEQLVTTRPFLAEAIRKLVLLHFARPHISLRELTKLEELRANFALRYRVWEEIGNLPAEKVTKTGLELDYTDRTATHLGAFDSAGRLIASARIVREVGVENPQVVSFISKIIDETGCPILKRSFEYPRCLSHPFDVLEAFEAFPQYYQRLITGQIRKAELSRVVTDPGYRKQGIGEIIVDSTAAASHRAGIKVLFLACKEQHSHFYERSGFHTIPGMSATRFFNIQTQTVAMDQQLSAS